MNSVPNFCLGNITGISLPRGTGDMDDVLSDWSDNEGQVVDSNERVDRWVNEGLRKVGGRDDYLRFVAIFGGTFVGNNETAKGDVAKFGFLSKHLTVTMETFAIVVYCNNYFKYMKSFWKNDDDNSSITTGSEATGTLFTNEGRGSSKYEGWSQAGYLFYNKVYCVLEKQRRSKAKEHEFDVKVRKMVHERNGKKRKRDAGFVETRDEVTELVEI